MNKDINQPMTVVNVGDTEKSVKVQLRDANDQYADLVTVYASKQNGWSKDDFATGQELPAQLNWVVDKQDSTKGFYGLKKWGDKGSAQRQGGGGGKSWQPKSPADIATMVNCNVNTTVAALVGQLVTFGAVKDFKSLCEAYKAIHGVVLAETVVGQNDLKAVCA